MIAVLMLMGCIVKSDVDNTDEKKTVEISQADLAPYGALPSNYFIGDNRPNPQLISLGEKLFNEKALSASGSISCSSCHDLGKAGTDFQQFSPGHNGTLTGRNSPTVLNAAGHASQFWDGRAATVEEQALGPILASGEMAMPNAEAVVELLKSKPDYVEAFKIAFPEESESITFKNVGVAIGAYERTLVTPSRWDMFIKGDKTALSEEEKLGFVTFNKSGCGACHNGPLLGGQFFMKAGAVYPWPNQKDLGRFEVTKNEADKMMFKVPSLRNVSVTGPYFHDGSVTKLHTAIKMMSYYQLGKDLTDEEATAIELWLGSTAGVLARE